jgi:sporulation protein YlmC with PRC-barrel domain
MAYNETPITSSTGTTRVREERPTRRVLSAGTLAGDRVRNRAGEDLGKIEEIMIDLESGRVAYAVLSFGGFLGIGDKLFAVPWESLELNAAEHEFILDVDKQTLENAPGFDKDNWPDMADQTWGAQLHAHYGQEPYWSSESDSSERPRSFTAGSTIGEKGNH